jgi:hypothetical protein
MAGRTREEMLRVERDELIALLEVLRHDARTGAKPFGVPAPATLVDALVHGLDVRRPLGRDRAVPPDAFLDVVDWMARVDEGELSGPGLDRLRPLL